MSRQNSRRQFLKTTAVAGFGYWVAGGVRTAQSNSAIEQINFACIGVGGKGRSDSADAQKHGNIVAICDIDTDTLDKAGLAFDGAKKYQDYRKMFDEMEKSIDAVTVSTPDHSHAPASVMAMKLGKHCFCQKPLTHSIYEARKMAELAREKKLATQMGNQGTSESALREAAALVKSGLLGKVSEVHVWTNRPIWAQGGNRPEPSTPPGNIDWELFLGPAPYRPYAKGYHPFAWRGWWDFGTGALGDMACHTMNLPYAALDLRDPISVQAESPGHNGDSYPKWSQIRYEFGATTSRPAVTMVWYDGGKKPAQELLGEEKMPASGALLIGEKGKLFSPGDYGGSFKLLGGLEKPTVEFTRSPGHFTEYANAIKGGPAAMSNFPDYAGKLSETVLLGNLAVWAANKEGMGKKIEWDAEKMEATNAPEVAHVIKPQYREGYSL